MGVRGRRGPELVPPGECPLGRLHGLPCRPAGVSVGVRRRQSHRLPHRSGTHPLACDAALHEIVRALSVSGACIPRESLVAYLYIWCAYVSHEGQRFDAETAFVAAMLHDIGLLKEFSTPQTPFEIDGANRAESLVRESGGT